MAFLGDAISGVIKGVGEGLKPILDKVFPDAKDRLEAELLITKQVQELVVAQLEINKVEAAHQSLWVAGWRPFIGWTCGGALAYIWIVRDWITYTLAVAKVSVPPPPLIMQDAVLELTLGMLGLGALRTFEKVKGVGNG